MLPKLMLHQLREFAVGEEKSSQGRIDIMKMVSNVELKPGTKEEVLRGFEADFPCMTSCVELDKYKERYVPWHWHNPIELFYMESGSLEYCTPNEKQVFSAGCGGMVNSNVLHMTRTRPETKGNVQLLHLFDSALIAGEKGSRIDKKYVMPLSTASQIELIALRPDNSEQAEILELIRQSFTFSEEEMGYEMKLRQILSEIWMRILYISEDKIKEKTSCKKANERIKTMMIYIHEHYAESISIAQLAGVAFLSERGCYRIFQECLHMTPIEYIRSYRLQMACQRLIEGNETMTEISHACGLGSSSYFGKIFRENIGCTPLEYRQKWQDSDT